MGFLEHVSRNYVSEIGFGMEFSEHVSIKHNLDHNSRNMSWKSYSGQNTYTKF